MMQPSGNQRAVLRRSTRVHSSIMTPVRSILRHAILLGVAGLTCALMGWYLVQHQEQWRGVAIERPRLVGVCAAACFASLLVAGPIFQLMTRQVGTDVGLVESTNLAIMTSAINTFVPLHGGLVARGVYLKKRHGLELSKFAATFIGYSILRLCVAATLACAAGAWLLARQTGGVGLASMAHGDRSTIGLQGLVAVAGAMAAAAFGACLVRPSWFQRLGFDSRHLPGWLRPLMTLHAGWQELVKCPAFMVKVLGLVALQIAAEVVMVWAAWNAVGRRSRPPRHCSSRRLASSRPSRASRRAVSDLSTSCR